MQKNMKKTVNKTLPRKSASVQRKSASTKTKNLSADVFNVKGEKTNTVELPAGVFGASWNPNLIHEVVVSLQSNARAGTADTKDRAEVRGGGKKPWKQKGTGRARHGSRRSPIWRGGGVTHGPLSEKDYSKKINKKVRQKALISVLSKKQADGEVVFVDSLKFSAPKTAEAKAAITALARGSDKNDMATKRKNAALIVLCARDEATEKSFRNFGNLLVIQAKDMNPLNLMTYKYVVFSEPKATLEILEKRVKPETKN